MSEPLHIMSLPAKDPLFLKRLLWPDVTFYDKQIEIIKSVYDNDETYVPAGNELGKDFVAGYIALNTFLSRTPCRVVTTSAKDDHLRVLWGEINRFIQTSKYPLTADKGGPLIVNHQEIKRIDQKTGELDPISYIIGMVAAPDKMAAMQGHHANPMSIEDNVKGMWYTLFISDESSSVPDDYLKMAETWAKRKLILGNCWECDNFFKKGVEGGDVKRLFGGGYSKKIIRIKAEDSPNVIVNQMLQDRGYDPTDEVVIPGVKKYSKYIQQRAELDPMDAAVILDATFYAGKEVKLFYKKILQEAVRRNRELKQRKKALSLGCDPGEGGDNTCICVGDFDGLINMHSEKTPDTSDIADIIITMGNRYSVPSDKWLIDRGGGGKQISDALRKRGYYCRTIGFGESATRINMGRLSFPTRVNQHEDKTYYKNRRTQMYFEAREMLTREQGYGIPEVYTELIRQLSLIPKLRGSEGEMAIPPKNKRNEKDKSRTLIDIIGNSPDESDAFVLMIHGLLHDDYVKAGVLK